MDGSPNVTLKQLATELGISASTISRVLNSSPSDESPWASRETQRRIFELAEERGYRKNPYAASLRTARSNMVGVVVPRLQDFVLATIYEGVDEAAIEHGYFTVVANSLDDEQQHRRKAEELLDRRADGLILGDAMFEDAVADSLASRGVPFVLVSRRSPGHVSVTCDDRAGGALAADHLVASGRRRFAVLSGHPQASTSIDRTGGFLARLAEHGIDVPPDMVVPGGFDAPAGTLGMERLLASADDPPEAVFAVNDFAAIGALGVLHRQGLQVPGDVALVGYNDTPLASSVGLTTVHSPMLDIGREGLRLLLERIGGNDVESVLFDPGLVVRTST